MLDRRKKNAVKTKALVTEQCTNTSSMYVWKVMNEEYVECR